MHESKALMSDTIGRRQGARDRSARQGIYAARPLWQALPHKNHRSGFTFRLHRVTPNRWQATSGEIDNLSTRITSRARRPAPGGNENGPPGRVVIRFASTHPADSTHLHAQPLTSWTP